MSVVLFIEYIESMIFFFGESSVGLGVICVDLSDLIFIFSFLCDFNPIQKCCENTKTIYIPPPRPAPPLNTNYYLCCSSDWHCLERFFFFFGSFSTSLWFILELQSVSLLSNQLCEKCFQLWRVCDRPFCLNHVKLSAVPYGHYSLPQWLCSDHAHRPKGFVINTQFVAMLLWCCVHYPVFFDSDSSFPLKFPRPDHPLCCHDPGRLQS